MNKKMFTRELMDIQCVRGELFDDLREFAEIPGHQGNKFFVGVIMGKVGFALSLGIISVEEHTVLNSLVNDIAMAAYPKPDDDVLNKAKKALLLILSCYKHNSKNGLYAIIQENDSGESIIVYTSSLIEAKQIVDCMNFLEAKKSVGYTYSYERTYTFDEVPFNKITDSE